MIVLLETLRTAIAIIAVFSVTIFVHELGHFLFMKLFGVRVERFAIGFGKRLFGVEYGGTDFCICALPFGGYVKPVGMHSKEFEAMLEGEDKSEQPGDAADKEDAPPTMAEGVADEVAAMRNKAWWQKVIILSAGCAFNMLSAVFAIFLLYFVGHYQSAPLPARVETLSGLETLNLVDVRKGDVITAVNGKPVANANELYSALEKSGLVKEPTTTVLTLTRGERTEQITVPVRPVDIWPVNMEDVARIGSLPVENPKQISKILGKLAQTSETKTVVTEIRLAGGKTEERILPIPALAGPMWFASALQVQLPPYIEATLPNLPAEKAGFLKGDTIVAVAGQKVFSSHDARELIMARTNQDTTVQVSRKDPKSDQVVTKDIQVRISPDPLNPDKGRLGIFFGQPKTQLMQEGFLVSVGKSFEGVKRAVNANLSALAMVFGSGNLSFIGENIGGPIAIGVMTAKAAGEGWVDLVMLFVMFNVMLAIINIMPIPVLDGGHIVFATVEAIIRRPIPLKAFVWIHNVFIVLILGLALTLTLNDVVRNAWRLGGFFQ